MRVAVLQWNLPSHRTYVTKQCFCVFLCILLLFGRSFLKILLDFLSHTHLTPFFMRMIMVHIMQPSTTHMVCPSSPFSCHKFSYMTGKLICLLLFTIKTIFFSGCLMSFWFDRWLWLSSDPFMYFGNEENKICFRLHCSPHSLLNTLLDGMFVIFWSCLGFRQMIKNTKINNQFWCTDTTQILCVCNIIFY